jgi:hypothetical protein
VTAGRRGRAHSQRRLVGARDPQETNLAYAVDDEGVAVWHLRHALCPCGGGHDHDNQRRDQRSQNAHVPSVLKKTGTCGKVRSAQVVTTSALVEARVIRRRAMRVFLFRPKRLKHVNPGGANGRDERRRYGSGDEYDRRGDERQHAGQLHVPE